MSEAKQEELGLFADSADTEDVLLDDEEESSGASGSVEKTPVVDERLLEDCGSAGAVLRARRLELKLSFEDVERETKMKQSHIRALEEGDLDELPQPVHPVYIVANVRKLGALYGLDEETLAQITAGLKEQILCKVPDDLSKSCYGHEVNEASLRQQKRLLIALFAIAGIVLFLITFGIVYLVRFFLTPPEEKVLAQPFDQNMLLEIQPKAKLKVTPLPSVEN